MGGKDAIVVDREADIDQAVTGVLYSAFGYQGQKCSACSRAIVDEAIYDEFLAKLKSKAEGLTVGPSDELANYMGPVINARREMLFSATSRLESRKVAWSLGERRPRARDTSSVRRFSRMWIQRRAFFRRKSSGRCWLWRRPQISITLYRWRTTPSMV